MEFTTSLFERRLRHILAAGGGPASVRAEPRPPLTFGFSRRRRQAADRPRASFSARLAALSRSIDQLVLDYCRSRPDEVEPQAAPAAVAVADIDGRVLWAPSSDWKRVCYYLMAGGLDPGLARFCRGNLGIGSVFVDVGASLGAYTLLAAGLSGEGVTHSFEADPETYSWLVRNLDAAGLGSGGRIRPRHASIGEPGTALDDLLGCGERVDVVRIGGPSRILETLRGMGRICRENPECRIVVDYCAALRAGGASLLSTIEEIERMGFAIQRLDAQTGEPRALAREDVRGAFSINLLLEQGRDMKWNL